MASTPPAPSQPGDLIRHAESLRGPDAEVHTSAQTLVEEPVGLTPLAARLPVELDVAVPVHGFKVRNLIGLEAGQLIESQWGHGEDLPLAAGEVQLAWCEFEVVESRLAVRVARLA